MKKYFKLPILTATLVLLGFSLFPNAAQAMCDPLYGDGERNPRIDNPGSVSLSADQNTLNVSGAMWYPGALCPDPSAEKEGQMDSFVQGASPSIVGPSQNRTTAGPHTYSGSLNVSALPNGTYTLTLVVDSIFGVPGEDFAYHQFTITNRNPLTVGSCSGSPNPATTGSSMTWSVPVPTGGTGSYTYSWSGTDSLGGTTRTVNKTYTTTGTKNASVVVTSGAEQVTKNCSITVNAPASNPTCLPSPSTVTTGQTTSISASGGSGGTSPYYTWNTDGGSSCAAGTPCSTSWTTTGTKNVTVTRNGVTSPSCPVTVGPPTNYTLTINKVADPITGDGTDYANVTSVSPDGQISCSGTCNTDTGSYAASTVINTNTSITSPGTWVGLGAGSDAACGDPMTMPARNVTCNMVFGLETPPDDDDDPPTGIACSGPANVAQGDEATFTVSGGSSPYSWSSTGNPGSGSGTSYTTSWGSLGTKTVTVSGGGSDTCSICVGAFGSCDEPNPPPTATVHINGFLTPQNITAGQSATVGWSSTNAAGCRLTSSPVDSGWNELVAGTSGSKVRSPSATTIYTARCTGLGGSASDSNTLNVTSSPLSCDPPVQGTYLNTNATVNASGGTGSYTWNTGGGTTCLPGSSCTTQYSTTGAKTVTLSDGSGVAYCTINVTVPPAALTCAPTTQEIAPGATANFTGSGGSGGPYSWSAPGGTPSTGIGTIFASLFSTAGTYYVTVSESASD